MPTVQSAWFHEILTESLGAIENLYEGRVDLEGEVLLP